MNNQSPEPVGIPSEIAEVILQKIGCIEGVCSDEISVRAGDSASILYVPQVADKSDPEEDLWEYAVKESDPNNEKVYQYFYSPDIARRIFFLINKLNQNRYCEVRIAGKKINYDVMDYVVNVRSYIPDNLLVWERHLYLTDLPHDIMVDFLKLNLLKFLWDIGVALRCMHKLGLVHGDCRLNNVGITRGNFVLLDFSSSTQSKEGHADLYHLIQSLRYHLGYANWMSVSDKVPTARQIDPFLSEIILLNYPLDVNLWTCKMSLP